MTFSGTIEFAPIERETLLTQEDAIGNARGTLPDEFFEMAEAEGWEVSFYTERIR